jgi:UDP-glucose 4-epimerase
MKVLITGSSGYLGQILCADLLKANIPVTGVDTREPEDLKPGGHFSFYRCSITDKENLNEIFRKEQPTHVIHFACSFNTIRNRQKEYNVDIGGSKNVLEAANSTPSVKQFIFSSSASTYGGCKDNPEWLFENSPLKPGKYRYGLNKMLIEESLSKTPVRIDLHIVYLRICIVTGPSFRNDQSVVMILSKFPFLPDYCLNNKIQFLHEEDLTSLIKKILDDGQIEGIFNLAPDSYSLVRDLIPGKRRINIPISVITSVIWILWTLKIVDISPASVTYSVNHVILNPDKLISRYGYRFKYSSTEAFKDAVRRSSLINRTDQ